MFLKSAEVHSEKNKAPMEDTAKIILKKKKIELAMKNEKWINEWIICKIPKRIHQETDEKELKQGKDLHIKLKYQLQGCEEEMGTVSLYEEWL